MARRKRKGLSKRLRFEVFKRDRFTCQYCGRTPPAIKLQADHILAVANGGTDEEANLLTSCEDCNQGKSDRPLEESPQALCDTVADRRERMEQVEAYNDFLMEQRRRDETVIQDLGHYWYNKFSREKNRWVFGPSRVTSIRTFLKHLAPAEIMEAMDIAIARKPVYDETKDDPVFRYFCGICWNKIKEPQ